MNRPCVGSPNCPLPAVRSGRCEKHATDYHRTKDIRTKQRDFDRVAIYHSPMWKGTRRAVLERDPFCTDCKTAVSTVADHVIPLRRIIEQGGDPYDIDNLEGVCASCHSKRTRQEQLGNK